MQLLTLESDVLFKLSQPNGRQAALAEPPVDTLRVMHPLYFAEPTCHPGAPDSSDHQKRQLGVFMQVTTHYACGKAWPAMSCACVGHVRMSKPGLPHACAGVGHAGGEGGKGRGERGGGTW